MVEQLVPLFLQGAEHCGQSFIDHVGTGLGTSAGQQVTRETVRAVRPLLGRLVRREFESGLSDREVALRLDRLQTTVNVALRQLELAGLSVLVTEADEPAAADFVKDALHAASSSPSNAKREHLGRLIGK